jgi:hypothetical protein
VRIGGVESLFAEPIECRHADTCRPGVEADPLIELVEHDPHHARRLRVQEFGARHLFERRMRTDPRCSGTHEREQRNRRRHQQQDRNIRDRDLTPAIDDERDQRDPEELKEQRSELAGRLPQADPLA